MPARATARDYAEMYVRATFWLRASTTPLERVVLTRIAEAFYELSVMAAPGLNAGR